MEILAKRSNELATGVAGVRAPLKPEAVATMRAQGPVQRRGLAFDLLDQADIAIVETWHLGDPLEGAADRPPAKCPSLLVALPRPLIPLCAGAPAASKSSSAVQSGSLAESQPAVDNVQAGVDCQMSALA